MAAWPSRVMTAKLCTSLYLLQYTLLMRVCNLPGVHSGPVVIFERDIPDSVKWDDVAEDPWLARAALYRQLMTSHSRYQILEDSDLPGAVDEGAEGVEAALPLEAAGPDVVVTEVVEGGGGSRPPRPSPDGVVWQDTGAVWWADWQLPVFVVLFTVVGVLAITFLVLLWLKNQMVTSKPATEQVGPRETPTGTSPAVSPGPTQDRRWIVHPVLTPPLETLDAAVIQPRLAGAMPEVTTRRQEPVRIRAKGLLERRGSSASLTIELLPSGHEAPCCVVTPTRECASEEYLLSAGNVLSRSELRQCLRDTRSLHREFWDLPSNHPETTSVAGCGTKNRYRTILPNERSRVRLRTAEAEYINANYVRGYDGEERAYIATQGPLPHTVADFWSLAWQENVPVIVMITKLYEQGRPKCERYIPAEVGETATYGDVGVTLVALEPRDNCVLRRLTIQRGEEIRRLSHFWYDSWPDHKTPAGALDLVALAREVEELRLQGAAGGDGPEGAKRSGPVLVHCSAGIGRTGCFIAVSVGIRQLLEEDNVDILGIVCQMRYDRGGMIQTAEQYEFVHRALCLFEQTLPAPPSE